MNTMTDDRQTRYAWGGDEYLFIEVAESMSLQTFLLVSKLAKAIETAGLDGVSDVCPANASLLLRYDPDLVSPRTLKSAVQGLEHEIRRERPENGATVTARIIEVPVWYGDPYTEEVMHRFRSSHQTPDKSDLEYCADINGFESPAELIRRHHETPWMVTAVGFVAGLPFMYQLVPQQDQIQAPKYLSPRTDTPSLTVGHAGCFCCVYSVRGAGGYQMLGRAASPIFAPDSILPDFQDSMILFKAGDIVKFTAVDGDEYHDISKRCEDGTFRYRRSKVEFDVEVWEKDPHAYAGRLTEGLNVSAD